MPLYTTPVTAVAGQNLSAANWNAGVRDSLENLARPPRARVFRSTVQSIPNAVATIITYSGEHHDSDNLYDPASPGRLVVPAGCSGIWHVGFCGQFAINGAGARHFGLMKNGTLFAAFNSVGNASWYVGGVVSLDIFAAAGEYFECSAYQTSGAPLNVDSVYPVAMWARQVSR